MWSAGQRGLRCEPTTRTINGHAGWSQTITKIASGNEGTRRGQEAASRIKKDNQGKSGEMLQISRAADDGGDEKEW